MTRTQSTYFIALWVALLGVLAGCQGEGDKGQAPAGSSTPASVSSTPASAATASADGQADEVVPADYEQKVEGEITSTNYKTELEKLAAEAN